jgi:hypothetical protein
MMFRTPRFYDAGPTTPTTELTCAAVSTEQASVGDAANAGIASAVSRTTARSGSRRTVGCIGETSF